MTRDLTPAVTTALEQRQLRQGYLTFFDFGSGPVYLWSGIGELDYGGNTYQGVGTLGSVGTIGEQSTLEGRGTTFSLSGVPSSLIAIALGEYYQGRRCTVDVALFDDSWQIINDPIRLFTGRMDTMQVDDSGETATISVAAESRWIDLRRFNRIAYYTDADQQRVYPGDLGLEHVPAMQDAVIQWGRTTFQGAPAPTSPGSGQDVDSPVVIPPTEGGDAGAGSGGESAPGPDPGAEGPGVDV